MLPLPTLNHQLLQKAQAQGFVVKANSPEAWQICNPSGVPWTLRYNSTQERWILVVQDIPQIRFTPSEAIDFLAWLKQTPSTWGKVASLT